MTIDRLLLYCVEMNFLLKFVAGCLILFGVMGLGVEIDNLTSGTSKRPILGFALGIGFCAAGAGVLRVAKRRALRAQHAAAKVREQLVLRIARAHSWRLTPAQVAADSDLTVAEATEELDRLAKHGACELDFGENTPVIYRFAGAPALSDH